MGKVLPIVILAAVVYLALQIGAIALFVRLAHPGEVMTIVGGATIGGVFLLLQQLVLTPFVQRWISRRFG